MIPNRIGIKDIARQAGVSVSTVFISLANRPGVSDETRERVQELSRKLGYHPLRHAPLFKNQSSHFKELRFGFLSLGRDESVFAKSPLGIQTVPMRIRMEFQVIAELQDDQMVIDHALEFAQGLDGMILSGKVDRKLLNSLQREKIPHVVYGFPSEKPDAASNYCQIITSDMVEMGKVATETLIQGGHSRIAFICQALPKGLWADRWLHGYRWALGENDLRFDPHLIKVCDESLTAETQAQELLSLKSRPTAFVLPDIRIGASFLNIMKSLRINVPKEAVVIGGIEENIRNHGVSDYPWIGPDPENFALVVLKQLKQLVKDQLPCTTTVLIPMITKNLPTVESMEKH
jgi:LacI family transcriptional regulator